MATSTATKKNTYTVGQYTNPTTQTSSTLGNLAYKDNSLAQNYKNTYASAQRTASPATAYTSTAAQQKPKAVAKNNGYTVGQYTSNTATQKPVTTKPAVTTPVTAKPAAAQPVATQPVAQTPVATIPTPAATTPAAAPVAEATPAATTTKTVTESVTPVQKQAYTPTGIYDLANLEEYNKQNEANVKALYDAALQNTLAGYKTTYDQSLSDLNAARDQITPQYQSSMNALSAEYERQRRNNNMQAAVNGLNTGAGSQMALAQSANYQANQAGLAQKENQALDEANRRITDLKTSYQDAIAQATANNNYKLAAAMLDQYEKQLDRQMQIENANYNRALQEDQLAYNRQQTEEQRLYQMAKDKANLLGDTSALKKYYNNSLTINNNGGAAGTGTGSVGGVGGTGSSDVTAEGNPYVNSRQEAIAYLRQKYNVPAWYPDAEVANSYSQELNSMLPQTTRKASNRSYNPTQAQRELALQGIVNGDASLVSASRELTNRNLDAIKSLVKTFADAGDTATAQEYVDKYKQLTGKTLVYSGLNNTPAQTATTPAQTAANTSSNTSSSSKNTSSYKKTYRNSSKNTAYTEGSARDRAYRGPAGYYDAAGNFVVPDENGNVAAVYGSKKSEGGIGLHADANGSTAGSAAAKDYAISQAKAAANRGSSSSSSSSSAAPAAQNWTQAAQASQAQQQEQVKNWKNLWGLLG